jgi:hypothetical protein
MPTEKDLESKEWYDNKAKQMLSWYSSWYLFSIIILGVATIHNIESFKNSSIEIVAAILVISIAIAAISWVLHVLSYTFLLMLVIWYREYKKNS